MAKETALDPTEIDDEVISHLFQTQGKAIAIISTYLYNKGLELKQHYTDEAEKLQKDGIITRYVPRVRMRPDRGSVTFEWLHLELYRTAGGKLRAKGNSLKKGGNEETYSLTLFSKASPEEKELIKKTEDQLRILRNAQKTLTNTRKSLQWIGASLLGNDFKIPTLGDIHEK